MKKTRLLEDALQRRVADALGRHPHILVRRRTVGLYIAFSGKLGAALEALRRAGIAARPVTVNVDGEPDLDVLVGDQRCGECGAPVHPKPVGLELKAPTGTERPSQINYRINVAERRGIPHAIVRTVEQAEQACGVGSET